jgi:hypothetical protein
VPDQLGDLSILFPLPASNITALQQMGNFFPGKYQIAFFDGCDSFGYLDDTLAKRRAALNPDDATGTKYLDIVTNAMPAYFDNMPTATMALFNALLDDAHPKTYQAIMQNISPDHVVMATNEEDNVYTPGMTAAAWPSTAGTITEVGFVGKSESVLYASDLLPAVKYVFELAPEGAFPGGDGDLRVRAGAAPDATQTYKCKSYIANSNERCALTLAAPAKMLMSVTGDAAGVQNHYELRVFAQSFVQLDLGEAARGSRVTRSSPSAITNRPAASRGLSTSPSTTWPASRPNTGVRKYQALTRLASPWRKSQNQSSDAPRLITRTR